MTIQDQRTWALAFTDSPVLDFEGDAMAVDVRPTEPGEEPGVHVSGHDAAELEVTIEPAGERVRVHAHWRGGWWPFGRCDAQLAVVVPRQLTAHIQTGAGSIAVRDLGPCDLEVKTGAGRITLDNVQGNLHLETEAGQIVGRQVAGSFDVRTHAGEVQLQIVSLQPGAHEARTDVGAIHIDLAPGLPVQIEAHTTLGAVRNDYAPAEQPTATLRLATELGAIAVRTTTSPHLQ